MIESAYKVTQKSVHNICFEFDNDGLEYLDTVFAPDGTPPYAGRPTPHRSQDPHPTQDPKQIRGFELCRVETAKGNIRSGP